MGKRGRSGVIEGKKYVLNETQVKKWNDVNKNNEINKLRKRLKERKQKIEFRFGIIYNAI